MSSSSVSPCNAGAQGNLLSLAAYADEDKRWASVSEHALLRDADLLWKLYDKLPTGNVSSTASSSLPSDINTWSESDMQLSLAEETDSEESGAQAHEQWLRQLSRVCAEPFETQQSFANLMAVRRSVQKRYQEALDRVAMRNESEPLAVSDGSKRQAVTAAENHDVSFVVRLAALSIFPLIDAIEPESGPLALRASDETSDDEQTRAPAASGDDATVSSTRLRAKLLQLVLSMLEQMPAHALNREPEDVLDEYAGLARQTALRHAPGSETRELALGVLVGLAVQRDNDVQLAKLAGTLAKAICAAQGSAAAADDKVRAASFVELLEKETPLRALPMPFYGSCVGLWPFAVPLHHNSSWRGPVAMAVDGDRAFVIGDVLSEILCLSVVDSATTHVGQVLARVPAQRGASYSICIVGRKLLAVERRPRAAAESKLRASASAANAGDNGSAPPPPLASMMAAVRSRGPPSQRAGGLLSLLAPPPPPIARIENGDSSNENENNNGEPAADSSSAAAASETKDDGKTLLLKAFDADRLDDAPHQVLLLAPFSEHEPFPTSGHRSLSLIADKSTLHVVMRGKERVANAAKGGSDDKNADAEFVPVDVLLTYDMSGAQFHAADTLASASDAARLAPSKRTVLRLSASESGPACVLDHTFHSRGSAYIADKLLCVLSGDSQKQAVFDLQSGVLVQSVARRELRVSANNEQLLEGMCYDAARDVVWGASMTELRCWQTVRGKVVRADAPTLDKSASVSLRDVQDALLGALDRSARGHAAYFGVRKTAVDCKTDADVWGVAHDGATLGDWLDVVRRSVRAWRRDASMQSFVVKSLRLLRVNIGEALTVLASDVPLLDDKTKRELQKAELPSAALLDAIRAQLLELSQNDNADVAREACATLAVGLPLIGGAPSAQMAFVQSLLDNDAAGNNAPLIAAVLDGAALWWSPDYLLDGRLTRAYCEHNGITCDECRTAPVVGYRFKCDDACGDYDMCYACFVGKPTHACDRFLFAPSPQQAFVGSVSRKAVRAHHAAQAARANESSGAVNQQLVRLMRALLSRAWRDRSAAGRACMRVLEALQRQLTMGGKRRRSIVSSYVAQLFKSARSHVAAATKAGGDALDALRDSPLTRLLPPMLTTLGAERVPSAASAALDATALTRYVASSKADGEHSEALSSLCRLLVRVDALCARDKLAAAADSAYLVRSRLPAAEKRVVETSHPYGHGANLLERTVRIAGAKALLLHFDPQSFTAVPGNDFLHVYSGTSRGATPLTLGRNGQSQLEGADWPVDAIRVRGDAVTFVFSATSNPPQGPYERRLARRDRWGFRCTVTAAAAADADDEQRAANAQSANAQSANAQSVNAQSVATIGDKPLVGHWLLDVSAQLSFVCARVVARALSAAPSDAERVARVWLSAPFLAGQLDQPSKEKKPAATPGAQFAQALIDGSGVASELFEWMAKRVRGRPMLPKSAREPIARVERHVAAAMMWHLDLCETLAAAGDNALPLARSAARENNDDVYHLIASQAAAVASWAIAQIQIEREWQSFVEDGEKALDDAAIFSTYRDSPTRLRSLCAMRGVSYDLMDTDGTLARLRETLAAHVAANESAPDAYALVLTPVHERCDLLLALSNKVAEIESEAVRDGADDKSIDSPAADTANPFGADAADAALHRSQLGDAFADSLDGDRAAADDSASSDARDGGERTRLQPAAATRMLAASAKEVGEMPRSQSSLILGNDEAQTSALAERVVALRRWLAVHQARTGGRVDKPTSSASLSQELGNPLRAMAAFLQSDVSAKRIRTALLARRERLLARSAGLDILRRLLSHARSACVRQQLLCALSSYECARADVPSERWVRDALMRDVAALLQPTSGGAVIDHGSQMLALRLLASSVTPRALLSSALLPLLSRLSETTADATQDAVVLRRAAWLALRVLMSRVLIATDESSDVLLAQRHVCTLLAAELATLTEAIEKQPALAGDTETELRLAELLSVVRLAAWSSSGTPVLVANDVPACLLRLVRSGVSSPRVMRLSLRLCRRLLPHVDAAPFIETIDALVGDLGALLYASPVAASAKRTAAAVDSEPAKSVTSSSSASIANNSDVANESGGSKWEVRLTEWKMGDARLGEVLLKVLGSSAFNLDNALGAPRGLMARIMSQSMAKGALNELAQSTAANPDAPLGDAIHAPMGGARLGKPSNKAQAERLVRAVCGAGGAALLLVVAPEVDDGKEERDEAPLRSSSSAALRWLSGAAAQSQASEVIALARALLNEQRGGWSLAVGRALTAAARPLLGEDGALSLHNAKRGLAGLSIMGSFVEPLRLGASVELDGDSGRRGTVTAIDELAHSVAVAISSGGSGGGGGGASGARAAVQRFDTSRVTVVSAEPLDVDRVPLGASLLVPLAKLAVGSGDAAFAQSVPLAIRDALRQAAYKVLGRLLSAKSAAGVVLADENRDVLRQLLRVAQAAPADAKLGDIEQRVWATRRAAWNTATLPSGVRQAASEASKHTMAALLPCSATAATARVLPTRLRCAPTAGLFYVGRQCMSVEKAAHVAENRGARGRPFGGPPSGASSGTNESVVTLNCAVDEVDEFYFEATVELAPEKLGVISIGLAPVGEHGSWPQGSYRYQANSKRTWYNAQRQRVQDGYGVFFRQGHTVGFGWRRSEREIYFTRDGEDLGIAFRDVALRRGVPAIGLGAGVRVSVNLGQQPFKFAPMNVGGTKNAEKDAAAAAAAQAEAEKRAAALALERAADEERARKQAEDEMAAKREAAAPLLAMGYDLRRALRALEVTGFQGPEAAVVYLLEAPPMVFDDEPEAVQASAEDAGDKTGDDKASDGKAGDAASATAASSSSSSSSAAAAAAGTAKKNESLLYDANACTKYVLCEQHGYEERSVGGGSGEQASTLASEWEDRVIPHLRVFMESDGFSQFEVVEYLQQIRDKLEASDDAGAKAIVSRIIGAAAASISFPSVQTRDNANAADESAAAVGLRLDEIKIGAQVRLRVAHGDLACGSCVQVLGLDMARGAAFVRHYDEERAVVSQRWLLARNLRALSEPQEQHGGAAGAAAIRASDNGESVSFEITVGSTVCALWSYEPSVPDELRFEVGDKIEVLAVVGDWLEGRCGDRQGMVPSNYVQLDVAAKAADDGAAAPGAATATGSADDADDDGSAATLAAESYGGEQLASLYARSALLSVVASGAVDRVHAALPARDILSLFAAEHLVDSVYDNCAADSDDDESAQRGAVEARLRELWEMAEGGWSVNELLDVALGALQRFNALQANTVRVSVGGAQIARRRGELVCVPGASSAVVAFERSTFLPDSPNFSFAFYADKACTVRLASYSVKTPYVPLRVAAPYVYYRLVGNGPALNTVQLSMSLMPSHADFGLACWSTRMLLDSALLTLPIATPLLAALLGCRAPIVPHKDVALHLACRLVRRFGVPALRAVAILGAAAESSSSSGARMDARPSAMDLKDATVRFAGYSERVVCDTVLSAFHDALGSLQAQEDAGKSSTHTLALVELVVSVRESQRPTRIKYGAPKIVESNAAPTTPLNASTKMKKKTKTPESGNVATNTEQIEHMLAEMSNAMEVIFSLDAAVNDDNDDDNDDNDDDDDDDDGSSSSSSGGSNSDDEADNNENNEDGDELNSEEMLALAVAASMEQPASPTATPSPGSTSSQRRKQRRKQRKRNRANTAELMQALSEPDWLRFLVHGLRLFRVLDVPVRRETGAQNACASAQDVATLRSTEAHNCFGRVWREMMEDEATFGVTRYMVINGLPTEKSRSKAIIAAVRGMLSEFVLHVARDSDPSTAVFLGRARGSGGDDDDDDDNDGGEPERLAGYAVVALTSAEAVAAAVRELSCKSVSVGDETVEVMCEPLATVALGEKREQFLRAQLVDSHDRLTLRFERALEALFVEYADAESRLLTKSKLSTLQYHSTGESLTDAVTEFVFNRPKRVETRKTPSGEIGATLAGFKTLYLDMARESPVATWTELRRLGYDVSLTRVGYACASDAVRGQKDWSAAETREAMRLFHANFRELRVSAPAAVSVGALSGSVGKHEFRALALRFAAVRHANKLIVGALPFVDWRQRRTFGSLAERLVRRRALLFDSVVTGFMHAVLDATSSAASNVPTVTIDRIQLSALADAAAASGEESALLASTGEPDEPRQFGAASDADTDDGSEQSNAALEADLVRAQTGTAFGCAFTQLSDVPVSRLRPPRPSGSEPHYAIKLVFKGENVEGEGGPYRQFFSDVSRELSRGALPLFVPCPNAQAQLGDSRDRFVARPSARSSTALSMFEFLGRLMGVAIRTGVVLPMALPMFFWRPLLGSKPKRADLEMIDGAFYRHLAYLADEATQSELGGAERSIFARFVATLSDGSRVALTRDGARRDVTTADDARLYCKLAERARLREASEQVAAVRRGLLSVVPRAALALLAPQALERHVCGEPTIDVAMLRRHTSYIGVSKTDAHIVAFWNVLGSFDNALRRRFVKFAWAQERLPSTDAEFERTGTRMLIKAFSGSSSADKSYPHADTCFFNVMLPAYSSEAILKEKLLAAILTDSDSMNADVVDADDEDQQQMGGSRQRALSVEWQSEQMDPVYFNDEDEDDDDDDEQSASYETDEDDDSSSVSSHEFLQW